MHAWQKKRPDGREGRVECDPAGCEHDCAHDAVSVAIESYLDAGQAAARCRPRAIELKETRANRTAPPESPSPHGDESNGPSP